VGIASSSGVFPNEPLLARQATHMKKTFNRIKTDRGIKQESVVQTFSCAISPLSRDRMAVLQFPASICGVEDASIAFLEEFLSAFWNKTDLNPLVEHSRFREKSAVS